MSPAESPTLSSSHPLRDFPKWVHAFAWGGILALVILLAGVSSYYDGRNFWRDWPEARELRQSDYAERIHPGDLLRTRANSWSNLAYVLAGFYAVGLAAHDARRMHPGTGAYLIKTPALSILFGLACGYLGFGSGLFHASLTRWGQHLDVAAMYAPLLAVIAISVGGWIPRMNARAGRQSLPTWPMLAGLVVFVGFLLYRYKWSMNSTEVLTVLILTSSVLAVADQCRRRRRQGIRWLVLSLVTMVFARLCWDLDKAKKFSSPEAWLQGHAVWHLLTALSLFSIYFFYRTEPRREISSACGSSRTESRRRYPVMNQTSHSMFRTILSFLAGLSLPASAASGLFLKTPPAANAFFLDLTGSTSGDTTDSRATCYAIQGLVNRSSAEVYLKSRGSDTEQLNNSGKPYTVLTLVGGSGTSFRGVNTLFNKYHPSIQKMFVYDPAKEWTFYLAFMAGAQQNGIPVTEAVRTALQAQVPAWAGTVVDYRNIGADRIEGYDWALANLMPDCTKQSVYFARAFDLECMDYVAASKSFVFNLLSSDPAEAAKISQIFATPGYGVGTSLGGYAGDSVNRLANPYGIGYNVSDFYSNGSFWTSFPNKTYTQDEGQAVTAQDGKVYVAILLSDGDNLQFDQGALYSNWKDPNRGTVPVATALSPVLQEINTPLLDWYYANKTANDELIAGPCGFQFIYLDDYKSALLPQWCAINAKWTADAGFHTASVWLGTYPSPNYDVYTATSGVDNIRHNRNLFSISTNPRFSNGVAIFNERIRDCQSEQELYEDLAGIATNPNAPVFATGKLITARFGTTIFTSIKTVVDRLNADFPGKYVFQLPSDQAKTAKAYQPKRTWNTGNGTWNTSTANWLNSASAPATFANSVNTVVFEDASGVSVNPTITLDSTVTPLHVTMKSTSRNYTISGTGGIGGGTALVLDSSNTGTLTLLCNNTYTGGTTINGGTLKVGNGGASGKLGSGNVINNATLEFNTSSNNTCANTFSGTGTLANTGTGTLTLTGGNTHTGVTTVSNGVLILGNSLALQNSPLDTLNSITGGLKTTATSLTLGGLTGNKNLADLFTTTTGGYSGLTALTLNPSAGMTHSYSADIGNGNGGLNLIKTGLGTQILSGTMIHGGSTTIGQGTLALTAGNTSLTGGLIFGAIAGGKTTGTLDLSAGSATFGGLVVRTNSVENNTISIGAGKTLATNGNVTIGTDSGVGILTHLTVSGNGSWTITNPAASGSFLIGAATGATNTNPASLDLSGLGTFNANLSGPAPPAYSGWVIRMAPYPLPWAISSWRRTAPLPLTPWA